MMRRILFLFFTAIALLCVSSCQKDKKINFANDIVGKWELMDLTLQTRSATIGSETVSVFIVFNSDGSFALSQQLGAGRFVDFSGTWSIAGNLLSGKYSDGKPWGSSYEIDIVSNLLTMTIPDTDETYTYRRCN